MQTQMRQAAQEYPLRLTREFVGYAAGTPCRREDSTCVAGMFRLVFPTESGGEVRTAWLHERYEKDLTEAQR